MSTATPLALVMVALLALAAGCQNQKAEQDLQGGYSALEQKDYDKALSVAEAYLKEKPAGPASAEALYLKGRSLEARANASGGSDRNALAQARAAYIAALEQQPAPAVAALAHAGLANIAYWSGDYGVAEAQWTRSHDLFDSEDIKPWVWYRVGLSQQRQGKWEAADQTFNAVQKNHPGTEAADRAKSRIGVRGFYVQVASFANPASATKTARALAAKGYPMGIGNKTERGLHAVLAGPYRTYPDAQAARAKLSSEFKDALIIP